MNTEIDTPTPCFGNPLPFDVLIDHDRGRAPSWAVDEVRRMCGGCPIQLTCWAENKEEPWVQALRKRPNRKRDLCGSISGARAHYRKKETVCADCKAAEAERARERKATAALAKTINRLDDIPEAIRLAHAEHTRLKARGEEIPKDVSAGERTYQALRHKMRKAKRAEAAA